MSAMRIGILLCCLVAGAMARAIKQKLAGREPSVVHDRKADE
jgi:hypothetical protein